MKLNRAYMFFVTIIAVLFSGLFFIYNCTGRGYYDGLRRAEIHHLITGEYYNQYKILDYDSTYVLVVKVAPFDSTYWLELPVTVLEK